MAYVVDSDDLDEYTCTYCNNVFDDPRKLSCGHIYCQSCLHTMMLKGYETQRTACPECGKMVNTTEAMTAREMLRDFYMCSTQCPGCSERFSMLNLRDHSFSCKAYAEIAQEKRKKAKPKIEQVPEKPSEPSTSDKYRFTYECPYCREDGLNIKGLVVHCNTLHMDEPFSYVVCPICVAMPWGEPRYETTDFILHLNVRHRFDYTRMTDMSLDDDEALLRALQISIADDPYYYS